MEGGRLILSKREAPFKLEVLVHYASKILSNLAKSNAEGTRKRNQRNQLTGSPLEPILTAFLTQRRVTGTARRSLCSQHSPKGFGSWERSKQRKHPRTCKGGDQGIHGLAAGSAILCSPMPECFSLQASLRECTSRQSNSVLTELAPYYFAAIAASVASEKIWLPAILSG